MIVHWPHFVADS